MSDKKIDNDHERGLYGKYLVKRISDPTGKHDGCRYFVLDPKHDKYASAALLAYAQACRDEFPELARDLLDLLAVSADHKEEQ